MRDGKNDIRKLPNVTFELPMVLLKQDINSNTIKPTDNKIAWLRHSFKRNNVSATGTNTLFLLPTLLRSSLSSAAEAGGGEGSWGGGELQRPTNALPKPRGATPLDARATTSNLTAALRCCHSLPWPWYGDQEKQARSVQGCHIKLCGFESI